MCSRQSAFSDLLPSVALGNRFWGMIFAGGTTQSAVRRSCDRESTRCGALAYLSFAFACGQGARPGQPLLLFLLAQPQQHFHQRDEPLGIIGMRRRELVQNSELSRRLLFPAR